MRYQIPTTICCGPCLRPRCMCGAHRTARKRAPVRYQPGSPYTIIDPERRQSSRTAPWLKCQRKRLSRDKELVRGSRLQLIEDPADGRGDDVGPLLLDGVVRVHPGDLGSSSQPFDVKREILGGRVEPRGKVGWEVRPHGQL